MTVEVTPDRVVLRGRCGVEEAESLLAALIEVPERVVALEAERVHTALWQVLIALKPSIEGRPKDAFVMQHIMPLVLESAVASKERSTS